MVTANKSVKSTGGSNLRQKRHFPFSIEYQSEIDDRLYKGKFVSKKLSIRDLAALGVRKSQLNGGMHHDENHPGHGVDEYTDEFNKMVAHLDLSDLEAPKWWNLDEITDNDLVTLVYQEVISFENKFLGRSDGDDANDGGDSDGGSETGGSPDPSDTANAGSSGDVVDEEVQSPLEP